MSDARLPAWISPRFVVSACEQTAWSAGNLLTRFVLCVLIFSLVACSEPLPDTRKDYIGHWRGEEMTLIIRSYGEVEYERRNGKSTTRITGPLKEFIGDDFVVGIWFLTTRFEVASAPERVEGVWHMTVDGVALTRSE